MRLYFLVLFNIQASQRKAAEEFGAQLADLTQQLRGAAEREEQLTQRLARVEAEAAEARVGLGGMVMWCIDYVPLRRCLTHTHTHTQSRLAP